MQFFDSNENMIYDNTPKQLEIILTYCKNPKDLVDTVNFAYSNGTHSINTITCEWTMNIQVPLALLPKPTMSLDNVLEYCNSLSPIKNDILYFYSNETHAIDNIDCKWKLLEPYPNGNSICVPYVEKWVADEDWNNGTHYFDTDSCKWKIDPDFDFLNSKGCPQFCPKEETDTIHDFEETFGGPGNRHPAFLGFDIPEICTEDMIKHLIKHSSMFDRGVPYSLDWIGMDDSINVDDFNKCVEELLERNPKELENEN